jgi:hypothetical protein
MVQVFLSSRPFILKEDHKEKAVFNTMMLMMEFRHLIGKFHFFFSKGNVCFHHTM